MRAPPRASRHAGPRASRRATAPAWLRGLLGLAALVALAALPAAAARPEAPLSLPAGFLVLLGTLILANLALDPRALRPAARPRFWLFALAPVVAGALLLGPRDLAIGALGVSRQGLATGLSMSSRAVCLLLVFQLALGGATVSGLIRLLHFRKLRGLGFALGVAHNMLATLSETSTVVLCTLRLRGALRRHPWRSLRLFVVAVVSATLRHAEEVVHAAAARGFDAR